MTSWTSDLGRMSKTPVCLGWWLGTEGRPEQCQKPKGRVRLGGLLLHCANRGTKRALGYFPFPRARGTRSGSSLSAVERETKAPGRPVAGPGCPPKCTSHSHNCSSPGAFQSLGQGCLITQLQILSNPQCTLIPLNPSHLVQGSPEGQRYFHNIGTTTHPVGNTTRGVRPC